MNTAASLLRHQSFSGREMDVEFLHRSDRKVMRRRRRRRAK